jgi:hypothetical protein
MVAPRANQPQDGIDSEGCIVGAPVKTAANKLTDTQKY